jgi:hypothetical protein
MGGFLFNFFCPEQKEVHILKETILNPQKIRCLTCCLFEVCEIIQK